MLPVPITPETCYCFWHHVSHETDYRPSQFTEGAALVDVMFACCWLVVETTQGSVTMDLTLTQRIVGVSSKGPATAICSANRSPRLSRPVTTFASSRFPLLSSCCRSTCLHRSIATYIPHRHTTTIPCDTSHALLACLTACKVLTTKLAAVLARLHCLHRLC